MKSKKIFLLKRKIEVIKTFFLSKSLRKEVFRLAAHHLYTKAKNSSKTLPSITLEELSPMAPIIELAPYSRIDGNLSYYELIVLSSLTKLLKPKKLLEIGSFNGLSTLHLALNTSSDAYIHTLDMLEIDESYPIDEADKTYILDPHKINKKYYTYPCKSKIIEHLGNSFTYPFKRFETPDLIFIDGGHSYENVKNDTEKSLKILSPLGSMIWHDYTPDCPGVFNYLNSIAPFYPIKHIKNTALAYLDRKKLINSL